MHEITQAVANSPRVTEVEVSENLVAAEITLGPGRVKLPTLALAIQVLWPN